MTSSSAPAQRPPVQWGQVVMAAALMLATLPGRTQYLGLITKPMLGDLSLDDVAYGEITLWTTLLGAPFCLPAGWLIDRWGLRAPTGVILILLAAVVWGVSAVAGGGALFFVSMLLSRGLGQSALSVSSITTAGRGARDSSMGMAVYAILLSVLMAAAFPAIGAAVSGPGWRAAWKGVAAGVLLTAAVACFVLPGKGRGVAGREEKSRQGVPLLRALRTPVFWVFGGAIALFGLVFNGIGLYNEAVLAERGFNQSAYHNIYGPAMAGTALIGQFLCGWFSRRWSLSRLLAAGMFVYAAGLAGLVVMNGPGQLAVCAAVLGLSAGIITVVFFDIWARAFGQAELGRIQGAAQTLSVVASAIGPLLFAVTHDRWHSYAPVILAFVPLVLISGVVAWFLKLKPFTLTA